MTVPMAIRLVLVDDEKNALAALQDVLSGLDAIEIAAMFTNPFEAIAYCGQHEVEAVFLDIEMPGIKGLEAADRIQEIAGAEIVFVTAYDHYAVEAFERYAVDYLLKPVRRQRVMKTLERLISRRRIREPSGLAPDRGRSCLIRCFGRFEVQVRAGEEPVSAFKWRMTKVKELLAFLVHHRGKVVHKSQIIEHLWPGADEDKAAMYMHSCVYHVRKQIKDHQLEHMLRLNLVDDGYQLQFLPGTECDVDEFLRYGSNLSGSGASPARAGDLEKAAEIYSGEYMEYEDYLWAMEDRQKYQLMAQDLLENLAAHYRNEGTDRKLVFTLHKLIGLNPYHEHYHEWLMETYARMGDWDAFVRHYHQTEKMFREDLGVELPDSIRKMVQRSRPGK